MLCRCVDCLWALHFQSKAENSVLAYAAPPPGSHPETLAGGLAESGQEYLSICTDRMLRGIMEMQDVQRYSRALLIRETCRAFPKAL